jgi:sortase (surface protein transpeptidase)
MSIEHAAMSRSRRNLYRISVSVAVTLTIVLVALVFGHFGGTTTSDARILPPPTFPLPIVAPQSAAEEIVNGPAVNLSNASLLTSVPAPTRLVIPAIGVDASVVALGRDPDGSARVPSGTTYTSWYDLGPKPGEVGPAVILGHVDSVTGPGVFFRLRSLLRGDVITVQSGPSVFTFEVWKVLTYSKARFDTTAVFGPTPDAELRLITCGGPFDTSIGHYEDNIVVYAILTG